MAQEIGDAVLHFLGDSTDLDTKFDEVRPNAEKAFGAGAEVVEEGTGRMKGSMREARGEAMLLGEAFGIHLPRHVNTFIAQLPGVGQALSAAFSATAILFIAQALVEATKKASDFAAELLYDKAAYDESEKSVIDLNKVLEDLNKQYITLKKTADDYGKSQLQLAQEEHAQVKQSIAELNAQLKAEEAAFVALEQHISQHQKTVLSATDAYGAWKSGTLGVLGALKAYTVGIDTSVLKHKELDGAENAVLTTSKKLEVANQQLRISTHSVAQAQEDLNKKGEALKAQIEKAAEDLKNMNEHMLIAAGVFKQVGDVGITNLPPVFLQLQKMQSAAHALGVTTRIDLVQALQEARKALLDYQQAGGQDSVVLTQFNLKVKEAQTNLKNFGQVVSEFKIKSHGLWAEFRNDAKVGATSMDQVKQIGVTAFDEMSRGLEGAIQTVILATGSFTQALEKATASALASLASQAIVKALFYTAEGFAALAGFEDTSAGQYFAAAGEMAAVGAAAGLAAHAMSGGGGSGGSTQQSHNSVSNTDQSNRSGGNAFGVQHFATGGLISAPTLAVMGEESKHEAVLPLEDPRAMAEIGKAIGQHGGTTHHWHIDGVISDDKLSKVVSKISKMVGQGKVYLRASDSLRITKRSA